jgi:glycopeptide antibiotics resistance protein
MDMILIINDTGISLWPAGILALGITLAVLRRRGHRWSWLACFALFWLYCMAALDRVFFPLELNGAHVDALRGVPIRDRINLIPFNTGRYPLTEPALVGMFQNVLLTIPFGFGLNFLTRRRALDFVWMALGIGLGLESAQLLLDLALVCPYRVVDVTDSILNAAGVLLGYVIFRLVEWGYRRVTNHPVKHPTK